MVWSERKGTLSQDRIANVGDCLEHQAAFPARLEYRMAAY